MRFQRFMLAIAALVLCAATASAQLRFGITGGYVVSKLHFDKSTFNSDNRSGYAVGVKLDLGLPLTGLAIDAALQYNHRKTRLFSDDYNDTYRRGYIEIPVHLRYGLHLPTINRIIIPYAFTGPNFAFLCSESKDVTWKNRKTVFSWDVGLGVELFKHLQLQGSYAIGVTDAFKKVGIDKTTEVVKGKDKCWTLTATVLF